MPFVLDGVTAFEYWQSAVLSDTQSPANSTLAALSAFDQTSCGELSRRIARTEGKPGSLQILVNRANRRRSNKFVTCNVFSADDNLPRNAIRHIGTDLYVESPEFCLLRLAAKLPRLEFLRALTDMLGIYGISYLDREQLEEREPITTVEKLLAFVNQMQGVNGSKPLRAALNWAVERSASPRETSMDLLLALPSRMGGQGLPKFETNYEFALPEDASVLTTKSLLIGDVVWPNHNLVIEYNSDKHHNNAEQNMLDLEKITALQHMGKTVIPVSTRQFSHYESFEQIVSRIREVLGVRDRSADQVRARREQVHSKILKLEADQRELPALGETARWKCLLPDLDLGE